jgi:hypothetical protein
MGIEKVVRRIQRMMEFGALWADSAGQKYE